MPRRQEVALGQGDANRPFFHIMPKDGWLNDPNGLMYFDGMYHVFFQHVENKSTWDWGITWGHAVSADLLYWQHLPVALRPTQGSADSAGCWSGCCAVNAAGAPVAVYTGVRLRGHPYHGSYVSDGAPGEPMIESVMLSETTDAADPFLSDWRPGTDLGIHPPLIKGAVLQGWRDPFVYKLGKPDSRCMVLMGAGFEVDGVKKGCVMLYSADDVGSPWRYEGIIAEGDEQQGRVWECPSMVQLLPDEEELVVTAEGASGADEAGMGDVIDARAGLRVASTRFPPHLDGESKRSFHTSFAGDAGHLGKHLLVVCAYHSVSQNTHQPGYDWDPVVYYLGDFDGKKFDMTTAAGPHRLDLGDSFYAPNVMKDEQGRVILFGWLREFWPAALEGATYSGCLTVPRVVTLRDGRVFTQPHPVLDRLRGEALWSSGVDEASATWLRGAQLLETCTVLQMDMEVTLIRKDAGWGGLLFESGADDGSASFMVLVDWSADELVGLIGNSADMAGMSDVGRHVDSVTRVMRGPLLPTTPAPDGTASSSSSGSAGRKTVKLRVLCDGSAIEVYTSTGQVLSTRVHLFGDQRVCRLVSVGPGQTGFAGCAWRMHSMWIPGLPQEFAPGAGVQDEEGDGLLTAAVA